MYKIQILLIEPSQTKNKKFAEWEHKDSDID